MQGGQHGKRKEDHIHEKNKKEKEKVSTVHVAYPTQKDSNLLGRCTGEKKGGGGLVQPEQSKMKGGKGATGGKVRGKKTILFNPSSPTAIIASKSPQQWNGDKDDLNLQTGKWNRGGKRSVRGVA